MINEIQQILNKFDGGKARLWHFTASHDRLVIRLKSLKKEDVVYILFFGCNEISLPVLWDIHRPEVNKISEHEYQFSDKRARVLFSECQIQVDYDI